MLAIDQVEGAGDRRGLSDDRQAADLVFRRIFARRSDRLRVDVEGVAERAPSFSAASARMPEPQP